MISQRTTITILRIFNLLSFFLFRFPPVFDSSFSAVCLSDQCEMCCLFVYSFDGGLV